MVWYGTISKHRQKEQLGAFGSVLERLAAFGKRWNAFRAFWERMGAFDSLGRLVNIIPYVCRMCVA